MVGNQNGRKIKYILFIMNVRETCDCATICKAKPSRGTNSSHVKLPSGILGLYRIQGSKIKIKGRCSMKFLDIYETKLILLLPYSAKRYVRSCTEDATGWCNRYTGVFQFL